MTNKAALKPCPWKLPEFTVGDIVEVIAYPEWKGDLQYIAEVKRVIRDGEDMGKFTYATWPIRGGEGLTDGWEAKHLLLCKAARAASPDKAALVKVREFIESIGIALGPYSYLDGTSIVADSRRILRILDGIINEKEKV